MSSESSPDDATGTDGGYVHRPDEWDGDDRAPDDTDRAADAGGGDGPTDEEGLGRAGWVLVGVVVLAFVVIPGIIYLRPTGPAELGFGFLAAMLVLPFLPALLLGITAVWSMAVGPERR